MSLLGGGVVEKQGLNIGETYILRLEESLRLQQYKLVIIGSQLPPTRGESRGWEFLKSLYHQT